MQQSHSETHSERSANHTALASYSYAFSVAPDAYQGADIPKTYLPRALGFPSQKRAEFQKREAP